MAVDHPQIQLAIGSRYENIELVQVVVEEALKRLQLDEDLSHSVSLAVREAVANAVKHGNEANPDKRVEIEFGIEANELIVRVADQGTGFDPEGVADPLEPDNLLRPNGRGIFFMKQFMDEIDYGFRPDGGTVVTLRKDLTAAAEATEEETDG